MKSAERRLGDLHAFPPLTVNHLIVFVLARFEVKEIGVDGSEHHITGVLRATRHVGGALTGAQLIVRARMPQGEIGAAQIHRQHVDNPRPAEAHEPAVGHAGSHRTPRNCVRLLRLYGPSNSPKDYGGKGCGNYSALIAHGGHGLGGITGSFILLCI